MNVLGDVVIDDCFGNVMENHYRLRLFSLLSRWYRALYPGSVSTNAETWSSIDTFPFGNGRVVDFDGLIATWSHVGSIALLGTPSVGEHVLYCQQDFSDCGLAVIRNVVSMLGFSEMLGDDFRERVSYKSGVGMFTGTLPWGVADGLQHVLGDNYVVSRTLGSIGSFFAAQSFVTGTHVHVIKSISDEPHYVIVCAKLMDEFGFCYYIVINPGFPLMDSDENCVYCKSQSVLPAERPRECQVHIIPDSLFAHIDLGVGIVVDRL